MDNYLTETEIITRSEAKNRGLKHYFTGNPCKLGHVWIRAVSNGDCLKCQAARAAEYRINNPEAVSAAQKKWLEKNREYCKKRCLDHYYKNYDRRREYARRYNIERREKRRETYQAWAVNNKEKCAALRSKRRAAQLNRTPSWLTKDHYSQMAVFYKQAKQLFLETGIRHHVDHIIPLQGAIVCGLHVPWNLQVVSAYKNISKGNRIWPDMPE